MLVLFIVSTTTACVRIDKNVRYADRSERNVLDIYMPYGAKKPPLVVWIHGGAFKAGDKNNPVGLKEFLDAGFAVASINYRFSQEATWPAQLEDLKNAFTFLRMNAAAYGYDANRIASFGASAGGHLSAMAGIAFAGDPGMRLTASVAWFPPIDFSTMDEDLETTGLKRLMGPIDAPDSPASELIGAPVGKHPELAKAASPITFLEKLPAGTKLPAFLIMHGVGDPVVAWGQSGRLISALLARRDVVSLEFVLLPEAGHGSGNFQKPEAIARVVLFLKTNFTASLEAAQEQGKAVTRRQSVQPENKSTPLPSDAGY